MISWVAIKKLKINAPVNRNWTHTLNIKRKRTQPGVALTKYFRSLTILTEK